VALAVHDAIKAQLDRKGLKSPCVFNRRSAGRL
jgi:hypothetical protein